jgi:hypothetical protein
VSIERFVNSASITESELPKHLEALGLERARRQRSERLDASEQEGVTRTQKIALGRPRNELFVRASRETQSHFFVNVAVSIAIAIDQRHRDAFG